MTFAPTFSQNANSVSSLWHRRVKLQGKVRRRVQDLRIPSSSSLDYLTSSRPPLELSHNESARLAADGLLSWGMGGYQEALKTEGEVDFLSELEKKYFLENGKNSNTNAEPDAGDGSDNGFESSSSSSHSVSKSDDSDSTEAGLSSKEDENNISQPNVEVYLYTENRAAGLKDVVREFIRKAEKSLTVVTDHFSDVELLCDLLEASKKRFVSVHLFVDHLNLSIFRDMWQELKLQGKDFPKFSVHSVEGETYFAKTGRKLSGQVSETFIIADSTAVLTGSFSFSCLSWMVHRSLAFLVKGSSVAHFLEEFERLSSCSTPVSGFINVPLSLPFKTSSHTNKEQTRGKVRSNHIDIVRIGAWIEDGLNSLKKERTQTNILSSQYSKPLRQPLMQHMCMQKFTKPTLGGIPVQDHSKPRDVLHRHHTQTKSKLQNSLAPYTHSPQNILNARTTGTGHSTSALLPHHRQDKAVSSSTQHRDFNKGRYSFNCEDYWTQRQNRATITPPGIAAGINNHRREQNTSQPMSNHTNNSKVTSQERGVKQCVQYAINGPWGATYGLQTKLMSNGIKVQDPPLRHHILQSQTQMRSPTTSISTQPKESRLFSPATVRQPALEPKALQRVKPSSRLAWMTQNNTMRGPMVRQSSFSSYDKVQKMDGQSERRQFHSTSAKPVTRSKSMTERPEARANLK